MPRIEYNYAYTSRVNPPDPQSRLLPLTLSMVWAGLQRKVTHAHEFVPVILSCRVLSDSSVLDTKAGVIQRIVEREVTFRKGTVGREKPESDESDAGSEEEVTGKKGWKSEGGTPREGTPLVLNSPDITSPVPGMGRGAFPVLKAVAAAAVNKIKEDKVADEEQDGEEEVAGEEKGRTVRERCVLHTPCRVDFFQPDGTKVANYVSEGPDGELYMTYVFQWIVETDETGRVPLSLKEKYHAVSQPALL